MSNPIPSGLPSPQICDCVDPHTEDGETCVDCGGAIMDEPAPAEPVIPTGDPMERMARAMEKLAESMSDVSIMGTRRISNDDVGRVEKRLAEVEQQYERANEWIKKHGKHANECTYWYPGNNVPDKLYVPEVCTCGFAHIMSTQRLDN